MIQVIYRPGAQPLTNAPFVVRAGDLYPLLRKRGGHQKAGPSVIWIADALNEPPLLELTHLATHRRLIGLQTLNNRTRRIRFAARDRGKDLVAQRLQFRVHCGRCFSPTHTNPREKTPQFLLNPGNGLIDVYRGIGGLGIHTRQFTVKPKSAAPFKFLRGG